MSYGFQCILVDMLLLILPPIHEFCLLPTLLEAYEAKKTLDPASPARIPMQTEGICVFSRRHSVFCLPGRVYELQYGPPSVHPSPGILSMHTCTSERHAYVSFHTRTQAPVHVRV